jgi:hypothetical protein
MISAATPNAQTRSVLVMNVIDELVVGSGDLGMSRIVS